MLGYLYADQGNVSPTGQPFEGLTVKESCPDSSGKPVTVYPITPSTPDAYFMPGADPGDGYAATNRELYGQTQPPAEGQQATMQGFVTDFEAAIAASQKKKWYVVPGTQPSWFMGCYTPDTLPVLSALAKGFAVCDHWYASAPIRPPANGH